MVSKLIVQVAGPASEISDTAQREIEQVISAHRFPHVVERIIDFDEIVALNVYAVPGIIIDGVLKSVGRVPDRSELIHWLRGDDCSSDTTLPPDVAPDDSLRKQ